MNPGADPEVIFVGEDEMNVKNSGLNYSIKFLFFSISFFIIDCEFCLKIVDDLFLVFFRQQNNYNVLLLFRQLMCSFGGDPDNLDLKYVF